jgi:hypothetical protein
VGFSQGCGGVSAFLNTADAGYIDTAVAIDGIHWIKEPAFTSQASPWINFASLAAFGKTPGNSTLQPGGKCLIVTNSDTAPPACCRKTKFASEYIAQTVLGGAVMSGAAGTALPPGIWRMNHNPPLQKPAWNNAAGRGPAITYTESQNAWYRAWQGLWILSYNNIDTGGSGHYDHIYQSQVVLPLMLEKIVVPRWGAATGGTVVG